MRRRILAAAAVALTLVLSACGGLPESGPVIEGRTLGEPLDEPRVLVAATGPRDGASQEEVVRGFLRAGEDSDETKQAGKLFLAPQSVDLWRWSTQDVVIYDGDLTLRKIDEETVQVSAKEVARLTPEGRFIEQPSGTRATVTLGLRKVGGEWRIDLPREGFGQWLDSDQFDRTYIPKMVYYITPSGRDLVPDYRWFPNVSPLATTLARTQLGRVPDYLQNAVWTGVPKNTKLAVNAVPVIGGRAQVNLTSEALSADPDDRTAMWAQLTATLSQVSSVSSVSLAVDGTPLELPSGVSSAGSAAELGYDTVPSRTFDTALVRKGDVLTRLDPRFLPDTSVGSRRAKSTAQPGDVTRIPDTWTRLALSADGKRVAAISTGRQLLSVWQADRPLVVVPAFATSLSRPTFDEEGYLWVGGADSSGQHQIYVLDARSSTPSATPAKPVAVKAPWLKDRRVVSLSVAGDGTRLLVITTNEQGTDAQLGVSGIQRLPNGQPTALAAPLRQAQALGVLTDVVWLDTTRSTYAVLGELRPGDPEQPWVGTIGMGLEGIRSHGRSTAESAQATPVPGAVSITTVGGPRGIVITTADGWVWARAGSAWRQAVRGTDVLVPAH